MSLKICDHLFYGPFKIDATIVKPNHVPVVFAIVAREGKPWDPRFRLLDVGFSPAGGLVFADHPQRSTWEQQATGTVGIYLLDVPGQNEAHRHDIAEMIRKTLNPPNGVIQIHAV